MPLSTGSPPCRVHPGGPGGDRLHRSPHGSDTPSVEWSVILSGAGKFSDCKGDFDYTLSLTSSGDDGTITHVIYQQDTCIHNKPKAKYYTSVKAKNTELNRDVLRGTLPGAGARGRAQPRPPCLLRAGCPTHHDHVASTPGMHSQTTSKPQSPVVCQQCSFTKEEGRGS